VGCMVLRTTTTTSVCWYPLSKMREGPDQTRCQISPHPEIVDTLLLVADKNIDKIKAHIPDILRLFPLVVLPQNCGYRQSESSHATCICVEQKAKPAQVLPAIARKLFEFPLAIRVCFMVRCVFAWGFACFMMRCVLNAERLHCLAVAMETRSVGG